MSYVNMNEERQYLLMQKIVDHIAIHAYDINPEVGDEEYDKLYDDLINGKVRKVQDWTKKHKVKNLELKFKDYDPFFNINTREYLEFAKKIILKLKNEQK